MIGLTDFIGRWHLARRIVDRRAGQEGAFEGEALWAADDAGLTYLESGTLRLGDGPALRAERRYLWRQVGRGIVVLFADGRPFHRFTPGDGDTAQHLCGDDLYDVRYDFARWPVWQAVWTVRGPRKDHDIVSTYRIAPCAPTVALAAEATVGQ